MTKKIRAGVIYLKKVAAAVFHGPWVTTEKALSLF
jgi:hypothetical protein